MKVTIRKIAELAGVSRGTVDRVLNNRPGVKPNVRDRIMKIISELEFEPNKAAKALAYNRNPIMIGIIMPPEEISFFNDVRKGIEAAYEELKDFGIRIEYRRVSNLKPDEAVSAVDELISSGAAGLMISVMDDLSVRKKVNEAVEKGIPVVTFNSDITNCKRLCFVGQDLYKSGRVAAGLMDRVMKEGSNILAVTGSMEFQAHRARIDGFLDRLKELGKHSNVVEVIETYDRYEETYEKVLNAINKQEEIRGIYMAAGDIKACVDVVKIVKPLHKVHIICNDLMPEVIEHMEEGLIDFTIIQNPCQQGYRPVKILYEYILMDKTPENEFIYTEVEIKIAENI